MSRFLLGLLDLLAPPACAACDLPTDAAVPILCAGCSLLLEPASPALKPGSADAAAYRYQGPLADALRRFKYEGRRDLGVGLGALLGSSAAVYAGSVDGVLPVPLHPRKLQLRGWNPAVPLARCVASELGVRLETSILRRVRATPAQAGSSREARARNVRGAFAATRVLPSRRLLLVDDVRTTGATLADAARALTEHGHTVLTLALAWAPAP